jgi:hypothetical protein
VTIAWAVIVLFVPERTRGDEELRVLPPGNNHPKLRDHLAAECHRALVERTASLAAVRTVGQACAWQKVRRRHSSPTRRFSERTPLWQPSPGSSPPTVTALVILSKAVRHHVTATLYR